MAFESGGGQKFPYTYEQVFDGLLQALPRHGFKIKQHDKNLGRLMVSSGMSTWSWGENVDISVEEIDGYSTRVLVHSALKFQGTRMAVVTGEHRNSKNVNAIIFALNDYLKTQPKPQRPDASATPPAISSSPPPPPNLYVYLDEEVKGPFSAEQVKALLSVGTVVPETPCCYEGSQDWQSVSTHVG